MSASISVGCVMGKDVRLCVKIPSFTVVPFHVIHPNVAHALDNDA